MDRHAAEYFREFSDDGSQGTFHRVIPLHETGDVEWEMIAEQCPSLPRGWFELSRLSQQDRLDFTRDFWVATLPYRPHIDEGLTKFFEKLDDIALFVTQELFDSPAECFMVYSLKDNGGFFRGHPPATEGAIEDLVRLFKDAVMPADYHAFLTIHDGFGKFTDTGITRVADMEPQYLGLQKFLSQNPPLTTPQGVPVNTETLIPFYESFGLHGYQCFWGEWYPEEEMGNVYYSGIEKSLSDWTNKESWSEKLAFPTFLDWLVFYLEGVD